MTDIREQIEALRATQLCGGGLELHREAADTMEHLLAVYEAASAIDGVLRDDSEPNTNERLALSISIDRVQTRQKP